MVELRVETRIEAPVEVCFDMARDISIHERTCSGSGERAVEGRTSGPIELDEWVTFEAKHFGVRQRLTSKIVQFDRPNSFTDEMQKGAFKRLKHVHAFRAEGNGTLMTDTLVFESPFGVLGWLVDRLILLRYMRRFLEKRNGELKAYIEATIK